MDATFDDAIFALQVTLAIKKLGIGLMGWFDGGAWGGLKFLKASGMQHTMPGAKIPNKGWW